jgi:probable O-glycosylation ligase (exosortase A-associated)
MLRTLIVFAIIIPGVVAALRDRFAALLLYTWFAIFRPQEWVWTDLASLRLSLVLGLLLIVPSFASGIFPNVSHPLSIGALAFFGCSLAAQTQAVSQETGWFWLDYLGRLLLVCLLSVPLLSTRRRLVTFIAVVAGSFAFHTSKAGLASLLGGGTRFGEGLASGAFADNNGYAVGSAMVIFLLIPLAQNLEGRWLRRGFAAAVPFTAYALMSTFSRGGFLALAASGLAFLGLQRRRFLVLGSAALVVLIAYLVVPIPKGYLDRLETIGTYEEIGEDSAMSRPHFWRVAMEMVSRNPIGVGLRNFEANFDEYDFSHGRYGVRRDVHSIYFQTLAETGYLGAATFVGLIGGSLLVLLRVRRRSRDRALPEEAARFYFTMANGLVASMVAFAVGGAFISLALNEITWISFSTVAALDIISAREVAEARADLEREPEPEALADGEEARADEPAPGAEPLPEGAG